MLLVDDILLFPVSGIMWIFREVHNAAQEELAAGAGVITAELTALYRMLESGGITEEDFDAREKVLLERLDRMQVDESEVGAEAESQEEAQEGNQQRRGDRTHGESLAP
ncbi:MAG: gas vesicle protein GvpG [Acidobacteria bacterium]|nr:gas vesicle protein GvpG [Acidobacteriota bacterium]